MGRDTQVEDTVPVIWPLVMVGTAFVILSVRPVYRLAVGLWKIDDRAFCPILVLIGLIMAAQITRRGMLVSRGLGAGIVLMVAGLVMMVLGNLLGNIFLEFSGLIPLFTGLIAYLVGWPGLVAYWPPILIWCFAAPLPGTLLTALTLPLKMHISSWATSLLLLVGLPIAREGAVIDIGNYRLLVADACSGLQSMFSLGSVAILYVYLLEYRSWQRVALLNLSIAPIIMAVNLLRVIVLVLATYWCGAGFSEGPAHATIGLCMFAAAFGLLMLVDDAYEALCLRLNIL